jgi:hypothetical protein
MPRLTYSAAMSANQRGLNPLSGWQFEYVPWPSMVKILINATTAGVQATMYTGSETIQERSPVQGGGVAGTIPSELNTAPLRFMAAAGDRLKLALDEVLGGTPTVNVDVTLDPLG